MFPCETEARLSYADVGIDLSRYRSGANFKTHCPQCHDSRKNRTDLSLSVHVHEGEWNCFHCGWQSGLGKEARDRGIDTMHMGYGAHLSPTSAREHEQGRVQGGNLARQPQSSPPTAPRDMAPMNTINYTPGQLHDWAVVWAGERGLSVEALEHFGVSSKEVTDKEGVLQHVIGFPYRHENGGVVNVKQRFLPKSFRQVPQAPKYLYNLPALRGQEVAVIVEGEPDVIACYMAGWANVVSMQDGAPGFLRDKETGEIIGVAEVGSKGDGFLEASAEDIFAGIRRIIIATDNDISGNKMAEWLIEKYGVMRCWRVEFPEGCKDANDVLRKHGAKALSDTLANAKPTPMPGVRPLSAHREAVKKLYREGYAKGVTTGWEEFDSFWMPELGHTVIVSGWSSHGKTSWLNHLFVNLAHINEWNVALYSPEQGDDGEMLRRFVQIANDAPLLPGAEHRMSEEAMDLAIDWVGERFFEIHHEGKNDQGFSSLTVPEILARAEPMVVRNNLKVLVLDPWNEIEASRPKGMTVEEYVSASLSTIKNWAKRNRVLVIVVVHPRKPESIKSAEDSAPHPYEAAGAAHWYNKADVYLTVHRVKYGEEAGKTTVKNWKHRKEGITGSLGECVFKFDRRSERFYFHEAVVPALVGTNPYPILPDHLKVKLEPVMGEAVYHGSGAAWDVEEPF